MHDFVQIYAVVCKSRDFNMDIEQRGRWYIYMEIEHYKFIEITECAVSSYKIHTDVTTSKQFHWLIMGERTIRTYAFVLNIDNVNIFLYA